MGCQCFQQTGDSHGVEGISHPAVLSLCVLCCVFPGICSLSSCLARQYVFVNKPLGWTDAQQYCREKHTDLASIDNAEELNRLLNIVDSAYREKVWIGLYDDLNSWQWTLADSDFFKESEYHNWNSEQPNNKGSNENCGAMDNIGGWFDDNCRHNHSFLCYQDTSDPIQKYILIDQVKSWTEAQRFCREKHTDLVSVRNQRENEEVTKAAKGQNVWIGLFRDPWKWSDKRSSSFRNWNTGEPNNFSGVDENCVTMYLDKDKRGKWNDDPCTDRFPFFCYQAKWKELMNLQFLGKHGVNLNAPAVRERLLEQIKSEWIRLGLPEDTTLRWREQADGQVFHQEEGGAETLQPQC
ncbi:C-type mannose receptor 2-like [Amia ocellicauda]|uniref:C-type mannose receptor 2-like n=1 Tax=Amia ocellicauda TaxID=2972642 RepID=UPI0034640C67